MSGKISLSSGSQRAQHARGLLGVRAVADPQFAIGSRQSQLAEEHVGERVVVVLSGVNEQLLMGGAQRLGHGGGLDELGAVADDG